MKRILILASRSKRRAEILKSCGVRYKVIDARVKEKFHRKIHSRKLVRHNAEEKARAVGRRLRSGIILGCDTLVLFRGRPIGKPKNKEEARRMLRGFSGKELFVYTGLFLIDAKREKHTDYVAKTRLKVRRIPAKDIDRYLKILGPYDKAGGFSIEGVGSILFDNLMGSYFNVLGLPMREMADLFQKIGLDILDFIDL